MLPSAGTMIRPTNVSLIPVSWIRRLDRLDEHLGEHARSRRPIRRARSATPSSTARVALPLLVLRLAQRVVEVRDVDDQHRMAAP